ncbi:glycoside hydrolase superfamily [Gaertneriomyces semiglobifer]|nr:glycoside hydrolase superfamily [Gaertneriomyces semiglobifer]
MAARLRPTKHHLSPLIFILILCITVLPDIVHAQGPPSGSAPQRPPSQPSATTTPRPTQTATTPSTSFANLEPVDNERYFGVWLNSTKGATSDAKDGPLTPRHFNEKIKFNSSIVHMSARIVVDSKGSNGIAPSSRLSLDNLALIDDTRTDAVLYLSIFPESGLSQISSTTFSQIVGLCRGFNRRGRRILLRFAPGMNSGSVPWGLQPFPFIEAFRKLSEGIRQQPDANLTALVWAPYEGSSYPDLSPSELADRVYDDVARRLLDTNQDNVVNQEDNPYTPYWPGNEYVDWVGLSIYYPSTGTVPPATALQEIIQGVNMVSQANFYWSFVVEKNKPMLIAETGVEYPSTTGGNTTELDVKRGWWDQYLSPDFYNTFPRIKAVTIYEHDPYRVSHSTPILKAFQTSLQASKGFKPAHTFTQTTYNQDDMVVFAPAPPTPDFKGEEGTSGTVLKAAIFSTILVPIFCVAIWFGLAHRRFRKRQQRLRELARRQQDGEAGDNPGSGVWKTGEERDDVESVGDTDTVVNIPVMGSVGATSALAQTAQTADEVADGRRDVDEPDNETASLRSLRVDALMEDGTQHQRGQL